MPKGARRSSQSHQAILKAAGELILEKGTAATTIEAIADRAGVGKQTIYRWWPHKMSLFLELYATVAKRDLAKEIDTGSFIEDLRLFVERVSTQLSHPITSKLFNGMVAESLTSEMGGKIFREFMLKRFQINSQIISRAIARGELPKDTDKDALSVLVGGAFAWQALLGYKKINKRFSEFVFKHLSRSFCLRKGNGADDLTGPN